MFPSLSLSQDVCGDRRVAGKKEDRVPQVAGDDNEITGTREARLMQEEEEAEGG